MIVILNLTYLTIVMSFKFHAVTLLEDNVRVHWHLATSLRHRDMSAFVHMH